MQRGVGEGVQRALAPAHNDDRLTRMAGGDEFTLFAGPSFAATARPFSIEHGGSCEFVIFRISIAQCRQHQRAVHIGNRAFKVREPVSR